MPKQFQTLKASKLLGREPLSINLTPSLDLLDEATFLNLLRLERKRVERSGRHFVMMLVEPGNLLKDPAKRTTFNRFVGALSQSTRETDYKGWYERESILGVIFTDISGSVGGVVLPALLQKVGKALATALDASDINDIRIAFHIYPEFLDNESGGTPNFLFYRDLVRDCARVDSYQLLKRALDIALGITGLVALSPVFLAITFAIKLSSKGPVFFRQQRIGKHFSPFTFLKFRSMYADSDDAIHKEYTTRLIAGRNDALRRGNDGRAVFKMTKDPRVTAVGKLLRKTSLDELPQLINVLRGDMTLVGPRPCTTYEFQCYQPWHRRRLLRVKPGITGLWQVTGRSSVQFDDMVRLDLAYVDSRSLWLDLKILWQTPRAVIHGGGAY